MNVCQVAAGDGSRDYADIFLKFGVILVGPGSEGNYFKNKTVYNDPQHQSHRPFIYTIAEQLQKNDLVILKKPASQQWEFLAVDRKEKGHWKYAAYMNLMAPKRKHPYLEDVKRAVEFFLNVMS